MRTRRLLLLALVLLLPHVALADAFEDAEAAYERGDYKTAFRGFKGLADQGDAFAQSALGVMYDQGQGVTQNYKEAVKWYKKAADQGNASAQNNLGLMYSKGRGVEQNYVTAYMWYILAAVDGDTLSVKNRDLLAAKLTPAQITEAQRIAKAWTPASK